MGGSGHNQGPWREWGGALPAEEEGGAKAEGPALAWPAGPPHCGRRQEARVTQVSGRCNRYKWGGGCSTRWRPLSGVWLLLTTETAGEPPEQKLPACQVLWWGGREPRCRCDGNGSQVGLPPRGGRQATHSWESGRGTSKGLRAGRRCALASRSYRWNLRLDAVSRGTEEACGPCPRDDPPGGRPGDEVAGERRPGRRDERQGDVPGRAAARTGGGGPRGVPAGGAGEGS